MFRLGTGLLFFVLSASAQQVLYNGIKLPAVWPPRDVVLSAEPQPDPPYLLHPPDVIPIDLGRQLFVDDFLVEKTDLRREFHRPEFYPANPVLKADQPWEVSSGFGHAMPFSDGVWWDPADQLFKLWYTGPQSTLYATSRDGVHWEKPLLDVKPGTNIVREGRHDSSVVWLDLDEKDPRQRYKLGYSMGYGHPYALHVSSDGIHWGEPVAKSVPTNDRTTFFKNPYRDVWVMSLRDHDWVPDQKPEIPDFLGRLRRYWESPDFSSITRWKDGEPPLWVSADRLDQRRIDLNARPQLYNLDAVAYESIMLGLFTIWHGQSATEEKPNDVSVGYSRDGFHWYRPDRRAFIPNTRKVGDWNALNVQSAGGVCLIVGDRLYFYASGRSGVPGRRAAGDTTTGLATLRRDGFASMDADANTRLLTTRPVRFSGKRLFVNVESMAGELRVEVLDAGNRVLPGRTAADCLPIRADNTLAEVRWRNGADLSDLAGRPVKFRFLLRSARLFSFWVSPDSSGRSDGYVAAGGPGFTASRDTEGTRVYQFCCRPAVW